MARKGIHPNNVAGRNGGKTENLFSGILDPMSSDTKGKSRTDAGNIIESSRPMKKYESEIPNLTKSYSFSNHKKDVNSSFISGEVKEDSAAYDGYNRISENPNGIHNGEVEDDLIGKQRICFKLIIKKFSVLALHLLQVAKIWVEKNKPLINAFSTYTSGACYCVQIKIKHAYPIMCSWILHLAKLLFLFSMVWLDCSLRGISSLLHLGTSSFFTIVWCTFLSLLTMVGVMKMLLILVAACLVGVFIGLGVAILMIAITSVVNLWFYGNFWTTSFVIALGGSAFGLNHERAALFLTMIYSLYCVAGYLGWLGLFLGLNLSFISSDILIHFMERNTENQESGIHPDQAASQSQAHQFHRDYKHTSSVDNPLNFSFERYAEHDAGIPSTSGSPTDVTSEDEVLRLLSCTDHYSALGFARYENIDISSLKREYRKKAMLVHPDKNMGNEKAADAFKRLQNAYEVLLDSLKRKTYDDELRREEILNYFRRFQNISKKKRRNGIFGPGYCRDSGNDNSTGEARRIACKKCGDFHVWIQMDRPKSRARWCQDCKDFHHAKDGDGWVEQSFQPFIFGFLSKVDPPHAYVCADSKIYDATEWFICQGMRCPANSHKPTFQINTSVTPAKHSGRGIHSPSGEEAMTEEELFEWLQNAMQSGIFNATDGSPDESTSSKTSSFPKGSSKKKRRGKKQW